MNKATFAKYSIFNRQHNILNIIGIQSANLNKTIIETIKFRITNLLNG